MKYLFLSITISLLFINNLRQYLIIESLESKLISTRAAADQFQHLFKQCTIFIKGAN